MKKLLTLVLAMHGLAHAAPALMTTESGCRIIQPGQASHATWDGTCRNGAAEGAGTAQWFRNGKPVEYYEGEWLGGLPHGHGYWKHADGTEYEGGFLRGLRNGYGIMSIPAEMRYEGGWLDGERHGTGRMTLMLGGSYEGEWHHGHPDGNGVLVTAGGRRIERNDFIGNIVGDPHSQGIAPQGNPVPGSLGPFKRPTPVQVRTNVSYEQLTPQEKDVVRFRHQWLEENDEPPYPLGGPENLARLVQQIQDPVAAEGPGVFHAHVDADGKVTSVTAYKTENKALIKFVAMALAQQPFKPAKCQGKPCAMIYPAAFDFIVR